MKTLQEQLKELYDSTKHFEASIAKEAFKLIDEQCLTSVSSGKTAMSTTATSTDSP